MRVIAGQCAIFFAGNSRYPFDLEEMGMADFMCPTCLTPYTYYLYENSTGDSVYFVGCPMLEKPNHECIDAGSPSRRN